MLDPDAQVLSLEAIISTVRGAVHKRYRTHAECDDLVQEAAVYAWRKHEEGGSDLDCFLAGKNRARTLVHSLKEGVGDTYLGKPVNRTAHFQQSRGEAMREKIRMYIRDYTKLHGSEPSNLNTAKNVGTSHNNVRHHRAQMNNFAGQPTKRPTYISMNEILDTDSASQVFWLAKLPTSEFGEDTLLTQVAIRKAMATLSPRDRMMLYLEFWYDRTYVSIGEEIGLKTNHMHAVRKKALAQLGEVLEVA